MNEYKPGGNMNSFVCGMLWAPRSCKGFYMSKLMVPFFGSNTMFCSLRDYHYVKSERIRRLN